MSNFNRIIAPNEVSFPESPTAYVDIGRGGVPQIRESMSVGRAWEEGYTSYQNTDVDFRSFMAYIVSLYQAKTIFDITHYDFINLLGSATPSSVPYLKGSGQTGSTILTDGWQSSSPSAPLLRPGDALRIAGRGIVYDVLSFSTDGAGNATIEINPPLWEKSGWDSDNKAITINTISGAVKFSCYISFLYLPTRGYDGDYEGLKIKFMEAPS